LWNAGSNINKVTENGRAWWRSSEDAQLREAEHRRCSGFTAENTCKCSLLSAFLLALRGMERRVLIRAHLPQVSAVYEHFQCPICMSRIEEACLTPCGHRYCYKCIDECINRRWVWHKYLYHIMGVYPY